jgi:phosphoglycerate dehydrogenase-like enzyme
MAIRVHLHPRFAEPYLAALRQAAPHVSVWLDDDPHDPVAVELLLAWSLTPGLVASLPRLRAVCSIGAGVDKLLTAPDLPPELPVLRVSDPQQNQAIAQYVLACALRHLRELPRYEAQQAEARWRGSSPARRRRGACRWRCGGGGRARCRRTWPTCAANMARPGWRACWPQATCWSAPCHSRRPPRTFSTAPG